MEQYMYTYLNQKYGLKALIVEWAASIIGAVKTYLKKDHEVTLFAKILKNECDEEFRFIQVHVRDTLFQLVKVILRDKYPNKSETDLSRQMEMIRDGRIEDWIWQKILDKMYEESDSEVLFQQIRDLLNTQPSLEYVALESSRKRLTREEAKQQVQSDVA
jgi:hypothetical protein